MRVLSTGRSPTGQVVDGIEQREFFFGAEIIVVVIENQRSEAHSGFNAYCPRDAVTNNVVLNSNTAGDRC